MYCLHYDYKKYLTFVINNIININHASTYNIANNLNTRYGLRIHFYII